MNGLYRFALLLLLGSLAAGCGSSKKPRELLPVSGTVTLDGKPLQEGEIYFKKTVAGEVDILPIKDGHFEGKAGVGPRRVEIYAYHEKEVVPMPGEPPEKTSENYIPARYNAKSTLTAEIGAANSSPLKFEITSH